MKLILIFFISIKRLPPHIIHIIHTFYENFFNFIDFAVDGRKYSWCI